LTSFSTPATSPSSLETSSRTTLAACPSANGATHTATNRPLPTFLGALPNATFEFKITCNTNWVGGYEGVMDVAILSSIFSLNDCMGACAKFTWQAPPKFYKIQGCSGAVWTILQRMCATSRRMFRNRLAMTPTAILDMTALFCCISDMTVLRLCRALSCHIFLGSHFPQSEIDICKPSCFTGDCRYCSRIIFFVSAFDD
jgi:hypothetical protein